MCPQQISTSEPTMSENPLSEASEISLEEAFNRDPLELTRQDRDKIVAELRRARENWIKEEAGGKKQSKSGKAPPPPNLKLSDLGL
jgi:hypothetical protein